MQDDHVMQDDRGTVRTTMSTMTKVSMGADFLRNHIPRLGGLSDCSMKTMQVDIVPKAETVFLAPLLTLRPITAYLHAAP
jgi:hypothetical protein